MRDLLLCAKHLFIEPNRIRDRVYWAGGRSAKFGRAETRGGPYYLGSGELATALAATRRDLRKVMLGALKLKTPLIIGSAGSAGAKPHLEQTLAIIREIARK